MTITLDNDFRWIVPQRQLFEKRTASSAAIGRQGVSTFRNEDLQRTIYSPPFVYGPTHLGRSSWQKFI